MIKFTVYDDYKFGCEIHNETFDITFLLKKYEQENIINYFFKNGYKVTFDGNNLTLIGKGTTLEFKNITLDDQDNKFTDESLLALINDAKKKLEEPPQKDSLTTRITAFWKKFKKNLGLKIGTGLFVSLLVSMYAMGIMADELDQVQEKEEQFKSSIDNLATGAIVSECFASIEAKLVIDSASLSYMEANEFIEASDLNYYDAEIESNLDAYFLTEDNVTLYSQNNNLKRTLSNY